jgi:hypothetical protein
MSRHEDSSTPATDHGFSELADTRQSPKGPPVPDLLSKLGEEVTSRSTPGGRSSPWPPASEAEVASSRLAPARLDAPGRQRLSRRPLRPRRGIRLLGAGLPSRSQRSSPGQHLRGAVPPTAAHGAVIRTCRPQSHGAGPVPTDEPNLHAIRYESAGGGSVRDQRAISPICDGGDSRGSLGAAAHAPSGRRALRPHGRNNGSASQHAALQPTARSFRPTTPGSSDDPSRAHAADARTALPHG